MIFDTHAHYDDPSFDKDREELLISLKDKGVGFVVNVCAAYEDMSKTLELTEKYPFIYGALGVHPSEVYDLNDEKIAHIEKTADENRVEKGGKIVAIGEIGLDYHYPDTDAPVQKKWFEAQIEAARRIKMPMIIHSRDAAKDTMDMMKALNTGEIGGIVHCYSYATEQAREYLDMGFYFGIGGVITFKNAKKLIEAVTFLPMESLVIETDSPYLSPEPYRGARNDSSNLRYVVEKIAQIKSLSQEEVIRITEENAKRVYRIDR